MDAGIKTGGAFNAQADQAWRDHQDTLKDTGDQYKDLLRTIEGFGKDSARAMADFFMGTETSFSDMLRSMTRELLQMTIYEGFMKNIFGWASGGLVGAGKGLISFFSPTAHQGWEVGTRPPGGKWVDPAVFATARRYHSGLAADEFPAILQAGETVLPKGTGKGHQLNTRINVTVNTTAGPGGQADPQAAKQTADLVAKAVEAEFDSYLQKQLRPGGLLNQGRKA